VELGQARMTQGAGSQEPGDGENPDINGGDPSAAYKPVGHCPCYAGETQGFGLTLIFVGGHAFHRGLQKEQPPQMATLLLHMMANLLYELGDRIAKLWSLVVEVKSSFGVVVPAYYWDEGRKTFKRMPEAGELASRKCISTVPWYQLMTDLG
jgi:hypothetical protein